MAEDNICPTCGTDLTFVPILSIDEKLYHVCPYNNEDADFGTATFEQIPYGDQLAYGFNQVKFH